MSRDGWSVSPTHRCDTGNILRSSSNIQYCWPTHRSGLLSAKKLSSAMNDTTQKLWLYGKSDICEPHGTPKLNTSSSFRYYPVHVVITYPCVNNTHTNKCSLNLQVLSSPGSNYLSVCKQYTHKQMLTQLTGTIHSSSNYLSMCKQYTYKQMLTQLTGTIHVVITYPCVNNTHTNKCKLTGTI